VSTGEIDVFVSCLDSPEWIFRLLGAGTVIENKWEKNPVETKEIDAFHRKAKRVAIQCDLCYFVSMSGFSSTNKMSAEQLVLESSQPSMIGIGREGVERMVKDGTPESLIRDRTLL
jgi:hypothetical protein